LTDADLLLAARAGNEQAWRTLYQRYLPAVWRQAYARVSDVHVAEDITSETMLALLRNIDRLDTDVPKIAGWLRSVVERKAADHHRKQFRLRAHLQTSASPATNGRQAPRPEASLESNEEREQVLRTLDQLSDRERIVLEWKYLDAMRVREIADRLGDTEKAIEAVLYRARREFRRLFDLPQAPAPRLVCDEPASTDAKSES
jgi:RNA polymerase sigma-70 factor, ECF subfamily